MAFVGTSKNGTSFIINKDNALCGLITVQFDEDQLSGKYVYLYNTSKNKYELLTEQDIHKLQLDIAGKYLVSDKRLSTGKIKIVICIVFSVFLFFLLCVYIGVKKRYWFW